MMAGRSSAATLNPASVPFFPSGIAIAPLDGADQQLTNGGSTVLGFSSAAPHEQERSFMSSASAASTEYRSANSSPARGSAPSSASVTSGGGGDIVTAQSDTVGIVSQACWGLAVGAGRKEAGRKGVRRALAAGEAV